MIIIILNKINLHFNNLIWLLFLALAAIANATMDTLKDHFEKSIFKDMNKFFWHPSESFNAKPLFLGIVELDAWHICKYILLAFLFLFAMCYKPILPYMLDYLAMFFWWGLWFEAFYSFIYVKK